MSEWLWRLCAIIIFIYMRLGHSCRPANTHSFFILLLYAFDDGYYESGLGAETEWGGFSAVHRHGQHIECGEGRTSMYSPAT